MTRELRLAGLFTRAVAFAIDGAVVNAVAVAVGAGVAFALSLFGVSVDSMGLRAGLGIGWWLLAVALYFGTFWSLTGQTPGMRAMGLRVITPAGRLLTPGQAVRRLLGMALCVLTLGVGFLLVLVDERRRGLHDRLAGTLVVYGPGDAAEYRAAVKPAPVDRGAYAPVPTQARPVVPPALGWDR